MLSCQKFQIPGNQAMVLQLFNYLATLIITEIKNFGEMLLYFALKQSILERPAILLPEDFRKKKTVNVFEPKKYFIGSNYFLNI